uniref:Uncharacterized protein n=1 Tax=Timema monikensis TaxID=170555 RepID=A0A7R9ED03_9NEOP|nr:unnamed protein product [Timema monikensis]
MLDYVRGAWKHYHEYLEMKKQERSSVMSASFESVSTASLLSVPVDFISLSHPQNSPSCSTPLQTPSLFNPSGAKVACQAPFFVAARKRAESSRTTQLRGIKRADGQLAGIDGRSRSHPASLMRSSRSPSSGTLHNSKIPPTLHRGGNYNPSTLATSLPISGLREMATTSLTSKPLRAKMTPAHMELSTSDDTEMESDTDGQGRFTLASKLTRKRKFRAEQTQNSTKSITT